MAETNTYTVDTTPETVTSVESLTEEEQDSLKVGEELVEQQEQLLAGKYRDAAELEKAYIELQKKLGDQGESETKETAEPEPEETEQPSLSDGASLITSASDEFNNDGKLSPETLEKFNSMSSKDLVEAYMEIQSNPQFEDRLAKPAAELTETEINSIQNSVGGVEKYSSMIQWAQSNIDPAQIAAFDDIIANGTAASVQFAVTALKNQYDNANGYEGKLLTGKTAPERGDVFRSQAELVAAMSDRRYDNDPAYRQDVIEKLDRSDLDF
tara:strand:- start:704 stop:1510 length:807 start_codon:yes stop_codon:yes gene_type:complete